MFVSWLVSTAFAGDIEDRQERLNRSVPKVAKAICRREPAPCRRDTEGKLRHVLRDWDSEMVQGELEQHPQASEVLAFARDPDVNEWMLQWAERLHPDLAARQAALLRTVPKVAKGICRGEPSTCRAQTARQLERVLRDPDAEEARQALSRHEEAEPILAFVGSPWMFDALMWADEACVNDVRHDVLRRASQIAHDLCRTRENPDDRDCVERRSAWVTALANEGSHEPDRFFNEVDSMGEFDSVDVETLSAFRRVLNGTCIER